jgi:hypothetical protein
MGQDDFSSDDQERRMIQAERQLSRQIAEREFAKTRLLQQVAVIDNDLESMEVGATARTFLAEQLGTQPDLAAMPGHTEVNNTVSTARRFVAAASKPWLRGWKIAAGVGTGFMGGVDIGAAWHVTGLMTLDVYGNPAGSLVERGGLACLTLVAYWLLGVVYAWGGWWRRAAFAMYGLIIALLTWGLSPTWVPKFQEMFGDLGSVFGGQVNSSIVVLAGSWVAVVGLACVFSLAGLLFLVMKGWLLYWLDLSHQHSVCMNIIRRAEQAEAKRLEVQQLDADLQHFQQHRAAMIAQFHDDDVRHDQQEVQQRHDAAVAALNDVRTATAFRRIAESVRLAYGRVLASLQTITPCLLLGALLLGLPGYSVASSTQEVEAKAPTLQILLDCSLSSPARNQQFIASTFQYVIDPRIMALPMASFVLVHCIGDSASMPVNFATRIQAVNNANGGTARKIVRDVHGLLQSIPAMIQAKPYTKSELIYGFSEAAKRINPGAASPNRIVVLSDLMEESALADCSPKAKNFCKLPAPSFKFVNTEVAVFGVGIGLPADKALAVNDAWKGFFLKAGLDQQRLALRRE